MILHLDSIASEQILEADLCIVGAGAAGITLAREFIGTRFNVIVLESGDLRLTDAYEDLNDGEVVGFPFVGMRAGRRRGLGGTTAAWGGQCCELDADDFLEREWIPNSGWPITLAELAPFYRRAEKVLGVSGERYDETNWLRFGLKPVELDYDALRTSFSVFSPRPRLGRIYRKALQEASNIRVILGATATNITTNANATIATGVDARSLSGCRAHIRAKATTLCTGTIESPRLLLSSRDVSPSGLGNGHDLVGRYLQDHPTAHTARVIPTKSSNLQELYGVLYRGRTWYWPKLALSPERQKKARAANASAFISFEYNSSAIEVLREMVRTTKTGGSFRFSAARIAKLFRGAPDVIDAGYRRYIRGRSPRAKPSSIDLTCSIEQAPNPDSRVTLSDFRDQLGVQRARVNWQITDLDRHTFQVMTASVAEEFHRLNLAQIAPRSWLEKNDQSTWQLWDNYHQTGTTRMSIDPVQGVVDVKNQVHGVTGLFVSGAPTFPTSGYANPVMTIAAMSIRLSEHLKGLI